MLNLQDERPMSTHRHIRTQIIVQRYTTNWNMQNTHLHTRAYARTHSTVHNVHIYTCTYIRNCEMYRTYMYTNTEHCRLHGTAAFWYTDAQKARILMSSLFGFWRLGHRLTVICRTASCSRPMRINTWSFFVSSMSHYRQRRGYL